MKTPPLLLTLLLTCLYMNQLSATTQPPTEAGATTSSEAVVSSDPLSQVSISDEEESYIDAECRRFATDDEVTPDDLSEYIALCNYELTIAVKTALLERRIKKERRSRTIKASKRTKDQPQPM